MPAFSWTGLFVLGSVLTLQGQAIQSEGGMRASFEVASLRPASSGAVEATNLDLDPSDYFRYTGGAIIASGSLINYILFAYKIQDRSQAELIYSHLSAWKNQPYTLHATTASKQTKDQLRLMVQSLLAERFQLKVHIEARQLPVYALVVDHSPAPGLVPAPDDGLCAKPLDQPKPPAHSAVPPRSCQLVIFNKGELRRVRMGDYSLDQIAGNLILASAGALDARPVLNKTGLDGYYDLDIEFLPPSKQIDAPTADAPAEESGAGFEEALKRQAGLKLVKQTGSVPSYIVDRVAQPTAN